MENRLSFVILAAGEGKRLDSPYQKVVTPLLGRPMIMYLMDTIDYFSPEKTVFVVGHKKEDIFECLKGRDLFYAEQTELKGTADAVGRTQKFFNGYEGDIAILCGDAPLISKKTIENLIDVHITDGSSATLLTFMVDDPKGYGRIRRDENNNIEAIVEELNADEQERLIREVNSGMYIFNSADLFDTLGKVTMDNIKGEYYLTDTIDILLRNGKKVSTYMTNNGDECIGINTMDELKKAENILQGKQK